MNRTADCEISSTGEDVFASLREANTTEFTLLFKDEGVEVKGETLVLYKHINDSGCNTTSVGYIILIVVICVVIIAIGVIAIVLVKRSEAKGRTVKLV